MTYIMITDTMFTFGGCCFNEHHRNNIRANIQPTFAWTAIKYVDAYVDAQVVMRPASLLLDVVSDEICLGNNVRCEAVGS